MSIENDPTWGSVHPGETKLTVAQFAEDSASISHRLLDADLVRRLSQHAEGEPLGDTVLRLLRFAAELPPSGVRLVAEGRMELTFSAPESS